MTLVIQWVLRFVNDKVVLPKTFFFAFRNYLLTLDGLVCFAFIAGTAHTLYKLAPHRCMPSAWATQRRGVADYEMTM